METKSVSMPGKCHVERFLSLLKSGTVPHDVTFLIGPKKEEVKGHQLILKISSPVFKQLFSEAKELNAISINDGDVNGFKLFLEFLYTGVLPEIEKEKNTAILLKYAIKYKVDDLEVLCCTILETSMTLGSAVALYEQGKMCTKGSLRSQAQDYILQNANQILPSTEFLNFTNESLLKILAFDELAAANETQVFEAVLSWAKNQCKRDSLKPTGSALRNAMIDLIPLIRFPVMNKSDFSLIVAPSEVLSDKELIAILLYFNVDERKRHEIPPGAFNALPRVWYKEVSALPDHAEYFLDRLLDNKASGSNFRELVRNELIPNGGSCNSFPGASVHQIKFRVDTAIWMSSIGVNSGRPPPITPCAGIYCNYCRGNKCINHPVTVHCCAKVMVTETGEVVNFVDTKVPITQLLNKYQLSFPNAVRIKPKIWHTLKLTIPVGSYEANWFNFSGSTDATRMPFRIGLTDINFEFAEVLPLEYPTVTGLKQGFIPTIGFKMDRKL